MAKSELPQFDSLDKLVEFFDTHDLGEYWDTMPDANFDIDIQTRIHVIALDEDLAERLTEIARAKQVSSRTLVNTWLREKVSEQTKAE
jgi:CopG antitoxin of type II toxin-antitoxin system